MPDIDGLAMHRTAAEHGMDVPTVFMTATGDIPTIVQAMKLGASDLLSKPFPAMVLLTAVEAAIARHTQLQKEHQSLAELWRAVSRLTPREAEVCGLVASGLLNKQVAAMIRTTEKTVKVHRARMTQKLQAHSTAELVRIVDRVMVERDRAVLSIDGVEVGRPRGVDIIARVLTIRPSAEKNSA
jgi:FixJ family two-component response regulator